MEYADKTISLSGMYGQNIAEFLANKSQKYRLNINTKMQKHAVYKGNKPHQNATRKENEHK